MRQELQIGERGDAALSAINSNFKELYDAIPVPVKYPGQQANFQAIFPANTKLTVLSMMALVNTPTLRVGTSPNGQELVPDTVVDQDTDYNINYYCVDATTLYFTFVGGPGGTINARMQVINNYY